MDVVIYTPAAGIPPEAEAIADEYGEDDTVFFRNASAWNGEVERVGYCYTHSEGIAEAYEAEDVNVKPLFHENEAVPKERQQEGQDFYLRDTGNGWYNVVSAEGEKANEKKLRKDDAEDLRDRLNAGEVIDG